MSLHSRHRPGRLLVGLAALVCCSSGPAPAGGLLASPAGMALASSLLFLANQDGNELHVFDTQLRQFRASPSLMFPLSIPTVRRPGAVCGNATTVFTASSVDPTLGVIDAFDDRNDPDLADPPRGLREVGQIALPGVASDMVCAPSPGEVLKRKNDLGGPAAYAQEVDAGALGTDGSLPDGGLDERHTIAALPMAALIAFNTPDVTCAGAGGAACGGTQIWEATNDVDGGSCLAGTPAFCPQLQPLFTLPPQPPACAPVGPPMALRVDVSGANAGDVNLGSPNVDPSTLNRLMAADANSNCVASVNLDDLSVRWLDANGPTSAVFAMPYFPNSCLPGGDLFAAVLDGEQCERQGLPPVGGYNNCNGVSFLSIGGGGLLPEPLPYPFKPRHAMPPVRVFDLVQRLSFIGPDVVVSGDQLPTTIPFKMLAMVGTGSGNLLYIDIGIGSPDAGAGADDAGQFACPAAYLAPRLVDVNDHVVDPIPPQISNVTASWFDGGSSLGAVTQVAVSQVFTADGDALPQFDRLGQPFSTPIGSAGTPLDAVTCYALPIGSQICMTSGLVQKGAAESEIIVATYGGSLPGLAGLSGTLSGNTLQSASGGDLTTTNGGLLVSEGADGGNLTVQLSNGSQDCGGYGISAVSPGSLTLSSSPSCGSGTVLWTIVASGKKPFTVQGTSTGFQAQLWPMDGTFHLFTAKRWHYPANLIGMLHGAQQLADYVFGPIPMSPAFGSSLTEPRDGGADYDALDSSLGLALFGPLGFAVQPDAGMSGGTVLDGGLEVALAPGATWAFDVSDGIVPLTVSPLDAQATDTVIDGMAAYTDLDGGGVPHVYASYRGGNALIELNPTDARSQDLYVFH